MSLLDYYAVIISTKYVVKLCCVYSSLSVEVSKDLTLCRRKYHNYLLMIKHHSDTLNGIFNEILYNNNICIF